MMITVHFFARARDLAGAPNALMDLREGATVRDLRLEVAKTYPAMKGLLEHCAVAMDDEFTDDNTLLKAGSTVALLPPVSGG